MTARFQWAVTTAKSPRFSRVPERPAERQNQGKNERKEKNPAKTQCRVASVFQILLN
jgi:hypothetical protein